MKDINFVRPEKMYLVIKIDYIQSEADETEYTVTFNNLGLFLTKEDARNYINTIEEGWLNVRCVEVSFEEMNEIYERKYVNVFK